MPKPYYTDNQNKIQEIIRVDHAGEFGAKRIYEGQIDYTKNPENKKIIKHMLDQEAEHLEYFDNQIKTAILVQLLLCQYGIYLVMHLER